jgi:predicted MFS family arabinose efflux permease
MLKAAIVASGLPMAMSYNVVMPILADMSGQLARDDTDAYLVKMILGVIGLAIVVGAPLAGIVADRFGRRSLLLWSGLLFAGAGIAPFFLTDLAAILATRVVVGLAAAAFATAGSALVGDLFDEADRPRWMGALVSGSMVTALVTVPLSGIIGDAGWRYCFLLYLAGVPAALLAWFGTRDAAASGPSGETRVDAAKPAAGRFPLALTILALLVGFLIYTPAIYGSFQLKALGLQNPSSIGLMLTISAVVGALMSSQFGRIRRHFSARAMFCGSFAAFAVGMAALALAPGYHVGILGLIVIAIGVAWLSPNLLSLSASVDPARRGQVMGLIRSAQSVAPAVGITAIELAADELGVAGILLIVSVLAAVLAVAMAIRKLALGLFPAAAT